MSIKKCLGLNQSLSKESLYTWLYELTPIERAELFLMRTLEKLLKTDHKIKNEAYLLSRINCCKKEELEKYLEDKMRIEEIKEKIVDRRAKKLEYKMANHSKHYIQTTSIGSDSQRGS